MISELGFTEYPKARIGLATTVALAGESASLIRNSAASRTVQQLAPINDVDRLDYVAKRRPVARSRLDRYGRGGRLQAATSQQ